MNGPPPTGPAGGGGDGPPVAVRGCRVVTTSLSARLLIAEQLRALGGIDWSVVSGDAYPDAPPHLEVHHVPMRREPALTDPVAFWRLLRLFRHHRFAFVQTHTPKASLLALPAARLAGLTTIYTMHGCLFFRESSRRRNAAAWVFERWCCQWADRVFLQSAEDLEVVARVRICPPGKLRHIGNGIRLDRFPLTPPPPPRDQPTVVMISRLVAEKGCRDFLAVARALHASARFVLVGPADPDQRDALSAEECREAEQRWGVELVGGTDDVRPFLADADVVLLPSYREGMPRVAMEAAATGRPVVAYDVRGVREVLDPATGLLVPVGDLAALTAKVAELLGDPEQRAALGRRCAAHVARYSEDAVAERLRAAYRELEAAASPTR